MIKDKDNTTRLFNRRTAAGGSYGDATSTHFCSRLLWALLAVLLLFNQAAVFALHDEEVKVGVVVNTEAELGKIALGAINISLSDFYSTGGAGEKYKTRLVLHVRDSPNNDVVASADAALDLIKNEQVVAIIGPETSQEAKFIINLGDKAQVPIISYSASSPHLSSIANNNNYFIQATQNDSVQVQAITSIIQAFGWRQVVPIYVNDEFGGGFIPFLTDALQQKGIHIPYRSFITSSSTDDQIEAELYKLKSMESRVFIVHMESSLGIRIFAKAKEIGMVDNDYVWIVTSGIGNGLDDLSAVELRCMQGVVGVRTNVKKDTWRVKDFEGRWKRKFIKEHPGELNYPKMNVYGLWAYDVVEALARAVEKVEGGSNITFHLTSNNSDQHSLFSLEKSLAGPKLLMELGRTKFDGLSGKFKLIDGILESSTLEIVNVIGNGEKTVGFWTPSYGLAKELDSKLNKRSSILKENLGLIIWPGDSTSPPKGWVQPVNNQKKLKVLVPVKHGFTQFVGVSTNPSTNETKITGYCIDIFDAVMESLPYPVSYEYVPLTTHDRNPTKSYDELITQVYLQKADIVVGDTTIVANRSLYVDFTLPYTESGVNMLVPIKDNNAKKALIFLRPLSWDLWVASFCFFVFIAFTIWVLEHRINPHFRGPPRYQAGTSLYYSFSTMVFSNNQHVYSNLTRIVVIVWIFVVLILTQSYTASFTSMLTVDQLQPTVTDITELIKFERNYVGYQEGSFIKDLLLQMNFKESQLKSYNSVEDLHRLLSKGSMNGGVSAVFDEIPYLKNFLASYCSKYMIVPPTYKTAGFGFAFSKGSPLVDDVSRAVLNVTESEVMTKIEKLWIGDLDNCPSSSTSTNPSSTSLGLESFWVLFTIAGFVAFCSIVIFLVLFLHQHRQVWLHSDPGTSVLTRIKKLAELFDQKNMESHTFKKAEVVVHDPNQVDASTGNNTRCPPSPSSVTNLSEVYCEAYTDQSTFPSPSVPTSLANRLQHDDEVVLEMPNDM